MNIKITDYDLTLDRNIDESGANGIYDLAGDIGLHIGLELKEIGILPDCYTIFGSDYGQELIYNVLQDFKEYFITKGADNNG